MALIACPDCTAQVSSNAAACPSCGHPIKMAQPVEIVATARKHKVWMTIYLLVAIAGCGVVLFQALTGTPDWIGGVIAAAGAAGWLVTAFNSWLRNG